MNEFEPTFLPFNKNKDDVAIVYESIPLKKELIDDLCGDNDFDLIIMAATCITLTKYVNSTEIFIGVDDALLMFNEEDRNKTVSDYMATIRKYLNQPNSADGETFFNIHFDDADVGGEGVYLLVGENSLKIRFDSNKYTTSYMRSFLRSINKVISQFADCGIDELKIRDIRLREEEPVPEFRLKRNPLINELLEKQANKTPDKIALINCGKKYTFKEINDEANRIANALIGRGFREGSSIAFLLERNKTLITTFLGIIKAGCVAIPLDTNFTDEKMSYIKENSDSKYIVTYEDIEDAINPDDLISEGDASFPEVNLKPDAPIFLLYTSGSTGKPKGVISTHCGISNLTTVHIKTNYKKLLSISSIAFDISEEDILVALTNDMELIFANDDEIRDIVLLARLIEDTEPEFVDLTPSRLLSYLQVPEFCQALNRFVGVGCGGEPFTKNVYDSIKKNADILVYNGYGPLETSLTTNIKKIINPGYITNGKPLFNFITDVRDIDAKLLPYGVIGELYIGGLGVSKGYYKMDEKTKEVFVTINDIPYYKSGDNAIQLPSNEIVIKGRIDNQIKLRGQRVEPEEIEQVILKYDDIKNVVVMIRELNGEKHLCAYFTAKSEIDIEDLRNYLANILSSYMVPTFFIQLDEFPETTSGKIDRNRFPGPKFETKNINPTNNFEKTLYYLCCDILDFKDFGVTDNLFKLGFTSLTLMKLNSDIYHKFDVLLKHTDLMLHPTIREIAMLLKNDSPIDEIEKIKPVSSNKYPMSSQQKRLYVLYRKNPTLTNYNLPNVRKFKKPVDIGRLENAINKVIDIEEVLRTSLHVENGEYIQKIHKSRNIKVDFVKLDDNADIDEVLCSYVHPFNLEDEPLLRIKVLEYGGEFYVFSDMHHILGDQISNDVLYNKIIDAYYDRPIYPERIQYKDYTFWVKKQQTIEADYWKKKEVSDTGSLIYADFNRPLVQTFNGEKISRSLDKNAIEKLARDNNTTIYKLLLSQFVILLHKYTNEDTVQIGTVTSGRTHPDVQSTLGMFVNTLPFIQSVSGEDTLKETLIKTEEELSSLFANQNYTIDQIIADHNVSTSSSHNPLFNIVFLQNTADEFENEVEWDESKFDLTCKLKNSESELTIEFDYNKDIYAFDKINGVFEHFIYLIDNIGGNIDKKVKDIKILSPAHEERIMEMAGFNSDVIHEPIVISFKKQVEKCPEKVILSNDVISLTYNDLNLRTNSLSNYLKDKCGVKKQDNIVLIANRSIESVVGLLSIIKLNAVYVPVNPFSPKERINHIIEQVNAKVILTNIELDLDDVDIVNMGEESIYDYDNGDIESTYGGYLCILHTSGTTGVPKGVPITHWNMENFLATVEDKFGGKGCKVFYHTTNIGFDTSLFEVLFPILYGMHLYVINENYDFTKIPQSIINQKSMLNVVPAKLKMFLGLVNFDMVMKSLGQLILSGEILTENFVKELRQNYHPIIYNAYGPCEATVFVTIKEIPSSDEVTIGKANINTQIYILNNERQLSPMGIPGELCIGGKQVSEGYLKKQDLANKVFIDNPFGEGKLYCTGDLAFLGKDGDIHFLGRIDSQIKLNGQRVEVDEVNKQIEKNGDINQAVTIPNPNKTQLYSYIVSDKTIDIDQLLNDLELSLISYMIPASIMQVDYIPINSNGKIDTKKLPMPKVIKNKYKPPTNDIERSIVKIWDDVLNVRRIGINDNFYHLGGDSIKAIRIVALLQKEGIICNPKDILNYKTPYLIAKNVKDVDEFSYPAVEGKVDLLPIQKYFFEEIKRNNYTQDFILESKIDLDINLLQKAFDELTNIHDMMRSSFKMKKGEPVQEILPLDSRICEINEIEISGDLDESIEKIILDGNDALDVSNMLMDVSLIRHKGKSYLVFVVHHLIIDGISWGVLFDDLTYIYNQLLRGREIDIIRPYPYKSWVEDVKNFIDGISEKEKEHWIKLNDQLDDSKISGKSKRFSFNINDVSYDLDNSLMLSEEEFLALAIVRAYKKTYGKDIIINRESHGRDETLANVNRTVGWFTSQYPVSVKVSGNNDDISLMLDILNLKRAFNEVNNLGLNYLSMIYTTEELKFKHCPVTFNFLSTEFKFKNELFESYDLPVDDYKIDESLSENIQYGIDLNIFSSDDGYLIYGKCADATYLDDYLSVFIDNIKSELKFISHLDKTIITGLSESQLGIYLDEKVNKKGTAYSTFKILECDLNKSVSEISEAILAVIDKHPILKGRILDNQIHPLLICDAIPDIDVVDSGDLSALVREFDLEKSLSYFYIIDRKDRKAIFYDVHHVINDVFARRLIERDLIAALDGKLDGSIDLGFINAFKDSYESQFENSYGSAHEYYANELADLEEVNTLPRDVNGTRGIVSFRIPNIRSRVDEFAHSLGITVGNVLTAVFAYTYSRFAGSEKVYFNFTEHGRHEDYAQNAAGMFTRTIPILVDCRDDLTENYLRYFSDLALNSMVNSVYPFRLLASEFNLNNNVLFEYNFDLNDVSHVDSLVVNDVYIDLISQFLCVLNDSEDDFVISIYHSDKYSLENIIRFVEAYSRILTQMLDKDTLADIEYTSDDDLNLLDSYNQTEYVLKYVDILDAFNDNIGKNPDNPAVSYNDVSYSYAESAFIAKCISDNLKDLGVEKGCNVAFLVERSELYLFSILGILSAGAVYVPLDNTHPYNYIDFILSDTESRVLIVSDETYEYAKSFNHDFKILNISDIFKEEIGTLSTLPVVYNDLACILYTSGTTGVPKGVKTTRKALINVSSYYIDSYGLTEDDVFGLFSSIGFDVTNFVIGAVLCSGACLAIVPEDIRLDMLELNNYFNKHNVTHSFITTQVGKLFMASVENTSLEVLTVAGEKLGKFESPEDYLLVDAYGPTEAFAFNTSIDVKSKIDDSSIGKLNYNNKAYVLDNEYRRVPIGAVGELYFAGYQVAKGYLNRKKETDDVFIDNPFDDGDYGVLYRTGDIVRVLSDGTLAILARRDGQVKVRGNRVELSEVESCIRELDYVEDVTVQVTDNNELVAYVVADDENGDVTQENIRSHVLKNKLDYMVPSFVIFLDEIPLTVNSKVDRNALPAVDADDMHADYVGAVNEIEQVIVDAFEAVFNQKGIGLYDDFVRLGGNSITAIRLILLLQKNDISCSARDILNYKTPYMIAQNIENVCKISHDSVEGDVDLLPIQSYFFNHINKNEYSQHFLLKSSQNLDANILQESLNELINLHDMLRASYKLDENIPVQSISPINGCVYEINEYDICDDFESEVNAIYKRSVSSLNIENKLIDVSLIHDNVDYILLVFHHLIVDGVSWNILLSDLTNIYLSLKEGKEINMVKSYSYKSWVNDVKELVNDISPKEKNHWIEVNGLLDDSEIKGNEKGFNFTINAEYDVDNLVMLSEEEYWALAIARAYKKTYGRDIIFNRESHGRDESIADLNQSVGWFTSQYPVPVDISNDYDDISLMKDVYELKTAFRDVNHLGLNYSSLIYTSKELEYKHCPVTFNFLSTEFTFKNQLFESIDLNFSRNDEDNAEVYGIDFNIDRVDDSYYVGGDYGENTFIGDKINIFIENIKSELEFLANFSFKDDKIICNLSESQLEVYLNEKENDMGTAYSTWECVKCPPDKSIDEIKSAIHALIRKHPVLKGRILDDGDMPLFICDSYPLIEVRDNDDYSMLIKRFDLEKTLARFFIIDKDSRYIFYDIHHVINDAVGFNIIKNDLKDAFEDNLSPDIDLGFVYAGRDSFESKFRADYESAHEFYIDKLSAINEAGALAKDSQGSSVMISLPIHGVRRKVDEFIEKNNITVGTFLNSVFAYAYSRFIKSDKVYYNFVEHGRHESYAQNALGMFARTIPVLIDCKKDNINDYLSYFSDLTINSMLNSIYPYRLLAQEFTLNNDVLFEYNFDLNDVSNIGDDIVVKEDIIDAFSEFFCIINDLDHGYVIHVKQTDKFFKDTGINFAKLYAKILLQMLDMKKLDEIIG